MFARPSASDKASEIVAVSQLFAGTITALIFLVLQVLVHPRRKLANDVIAHATGFSLVLFFSC